MENDINDKEVNLESTNKHTKIQKLFSSKLFQIFFFIFLFLLIFDSFQILLSSIESALFTFTMNDMPNKELRLQSHRPLFMIYFITLFIGLKTRVDYNIGEVFGLMGEVLLITAILIFLLTLLSTIYFFKQTKKFILFKTNFKFSFYILFFICIYSVSMIIATNAKFILLHVFYFKDFSIYKILICIIIALITTFSFKKLINFTLKDKK